jgi:hypothetical protein
MDFPLCSINCSTDCIAIQYGRPAESHFEIYKQEIILQITNGSRVFWIIVHNLNLCGSLVSGTCY